MANHATATTIRTDDVLDGFFGAIFDYFDTRQPDSDGPGDDGANGDRDMATDTGTSPQQDPETILLQRYGTGRWHIVRSPVTDTRGSTNEHRDGRTVVLRHRDGNDRAAVQVDTRELYRRCGRCTYPDCSCPDPERDCDRCGSLEVE